MGKFFEWLRELVDKVEFKITGEEPYHSMGARIYFPSITRAYFDMAKRNPVFAKYLDCIGKMDSHELGALEQKVMPSGLIGRLEHAFDQDKRYTWYAIDCALWSRGGMG